jgi:hypothetical protein
MLAGPLTIAYVTAPLDEDVALTAKGGLPNVWAGMGANVKVGTVPGGAAATVNVTVTVVAA